MNAGRRGTHPSHAGPGCEPALRGPTRSSLPLSGAPEQVAEILIAYHAEGIVHLQICLEPTTCATIEASAAVLQAVAAAAQ